MKNTLHTIVLCSVIFFLSMPLQAQQIPVFDSYSFLPKYYNPAAQGGSAGPMVGLIYRSQFTDLPSDIRPVSYMLHADLSFFENKRIGVGLNVLQDEVHIAKRTNVTGFFGYHLFPSENDFQLALGLRAGLLNQSLDLSTATVNDPFDLTLMQATESKMQFNGGFGLQAKFAGLMLDVVLPQLFSSDIEYTPAGADRMIRYDQQPHVLTSLRYRFEGEGFAIEPNVAYRESFGKKLKAATFDFSVRGYFLKEDMLMLGGGYRMDEGGLHFSAGVRPIPAVLIFGAYETHSNLGGTLEAGVQYTFGETVGPPVDKAAGAQLEQYQRNAADALKKVKGHAVQANEKIELSRYSLNIAKNTTDPGVQQERLENGERYFPEIESGLKSVETERQRVVNSYQSAQNLKTDLDNKGMRVRNTKDFDIIANANLEAEAEEQNIKTKFQELKDLKESVKPLLDIDVPVTIQQFLSNALTRLDNKPFELEVLRVTASTIEFRYADADEAYSVDAGTGRVKSFADWLGARIAELKAKGLQFESATLAGDLLYENISTWVGAKYGSEFGVPFRANYQLNGKNKTSGVKKDETLSQETLAVLKLQALRSYLSGKLGLSETVIKMELHAPVKDLEYQQMTRVILNYRK